jgi:hypothetical protein
MLSIRKSVRIDSVAGENCAWNGDSEVHFGTGLGFNMVLAGNRRFPCYSLSYEDAQLSVVQLESRYFGECHTCKQGSGGDSPVCFRCMTRFPVSRRSSCLTLSPLLPSARLSIGYASPRNSAHGLLTKPPLTMSLLAGDCALG